jgi:hypothetical protein
MSFDSKTEVKNQQKTAYYLENYQDLQEIKEFEKLLDAYRHREVSVMGKTLKGYELYLHDKNLMRYSTKYPSGAVIMENLREYNLVRMKMQALQKLRRMRKKERFNQLSMLPA